MVYTGGCFPTPGKRTGLEAPWRLRSLPQNLNLTLLTPRQCLTRTVCTDKTSGTKVAQPSCLLIGSFCCVAARRSTTSLPSSSQQQQHEACRLRDTIQVRTSEEDHGRIQGGPCHPFKPNRAPWISIADSQGQDVFFQSSWLLTWQPASC